MSIDSIVKSSHLTYEQKVIALAREAENSLQVLNISDEAQDFRDEGIICDLFEGDAPYRPRYIVPDYDNFVANGSEFLELESPEDLEDLLNSLLILYKHVPSITSFPVFIGNLDKLIDPFLEDVDDDRAYKAVRRFFLHIDRTISDSFCHANIGPESLRATKIILEVEKELQNTVPNLTIIISKDSPKKMVLQALETSMISSKPSFANHEIFESEFGENYAIASCYNGLYVGGGSYTLTRLNLHFLAKKADGKEDFFDKWLPLGVRLMIEYMDERVRFISDESNYFETSFLVKEKLIYKDRFTAMFGMFGLAEAVNCLIDSDKRFGQSKEADDFGWQIMNQLDELVKTYSNPLLAATGGKYLLHAQVGIDTDVGSSPGCRIPIGEEPDILQHIKQASKFHKYFPSGIGDIFQFEPTYRDNIEALYDILKGSFKEGMRYITFYASDSDIVRISGYLVKRSEIEKLRSGKAVLKDTTELGMGAADNLKVMERKIRE
ncbi:MAG: YjjI family glycine radical enzyme [Bacillota bacterium]|nr:YjjI family glycine radical enzyme [Bacillota bacterium]